MTISTEKPQIKRVYVNAIDPDGKERGKSVTVYGATPEQVIEKLKADSEPSKRQSVAGSR